MNTEKRKFNKVMKARQRRKAYLKNGRKVHSTKFDASKFINSLPKQVERRK